MSLRRRLYVLLIAAAPVVAGTVLIWLFSLEGTLGMYQWIAPFQWVMVAIGLFVISAPLLAFIGRSHKTLRVIAGVLASLGILLPLAIGGYYLQGQLNYSATTPPILLITDGVGANGIPNLALVFRTDQATRNTLSYGEDSLNLQIDEPVAVREHVLALKDLKPGVRYQWRLNNNATCGFTTPPVQAANDILYHFGVGGDTHLSSSSAGMPPGNSAILPGVLSYVAEQDRQFHSFFLLGDFTNMGSSYQDWQFALNLAAPFTCSVPIRSVMGNHDSFFNGGPQYLAYIYPKGMELQTGSRLYYRIDSGRVHFIMLNMLFGAESFTTEQRDWFIKQMESIPGDDWRIVMMHSAIYASGSMIGGKQYYDPVGMVTQVAPLLEKYKVDLAITGHAHHLEFLQKNGVNYAVVGGLGAPLDAVATNKSVASVWYQPEQYGFIDVTIHPETIELQFRDPSGDELKSFTIHQNQ
jgi:acid phosphatase type 7